MPLKTTIILLRYHPTRTPRIAACRAVVAALAGCLMSVDQLSFVGVNFHAVYCTRFCRNVEYNLSMNDNQYFPTPDDVIAKMIAPFLVTLPSRYGGEQTLFPTRRRILEPSAGKGHILDYLHTHYNYSKDTAICVEIDDDSRYALNRRGYRVVGTDFLAYGEHYPVDLILMNPPFNDGVEHLLKAWSILDHGDIVCLLNAESIRNQFSKQRQVLAHLIDRYGSVEYIGSAFSQAEVSTDVEIAIVRLHKDAEPSLFDFDAQFDKEEIVTDGEFNPAGALAPLNIVESLVAQYDHAKRILIQKHELEKQYRFYTNGIINFEAVDIRVGLATQLDTLKKAFWDYIFKRTNIGNSVTSSFRDKFYQFQQDNQHMAFTAENVYNLLSIFYHNSGEIMKQCILEVFDKATAYHEKNVIHKEGWKTNKAWMINKKIIMPNSVSYAGAMSGFFSVNYYHADFIRDLDRAMCFLSGKRYEDIVSLYDAIKAHCEQVRTDKITYDSWFTCTYFRAKMFKKGTLHCEFLDLDLWKRFNQTAADGKGWIGGGY
jgi:Domain of unknown function (DUF4942)